MLWPRGLKHDLHYLGYFCILLCILLDTLVYSQILLHTFVYSLGYSCILLFILRYFCVFLGYSCILCTLQLAITCKTDPSGAVGKAKAPYDLLKPARTTPYYMRNELHMCLFWG